MAGIALADRTKRKVLREPLAFSDIGELTQVFTHPALYIPFAGPFAVYGGATAMICGVLLLGALEPAYIITPIALRVTIFAALLAFLYAVSRPPLLLHVAAALRQLSATGDLQTDCARFGLLGTILIYGSIARAERPDLRARVSPRLCCVRAQRTDSSRPVVLIQNESFFDIARLGQANTADTLPCFKAGQTQAQAQGRLIVPAWGANTMRTEFAVLSGLGEDDIGYDRYNPYHKLARNPVNSLAWRMRSRGYHTVCIHPYDRRFYRRDIVMPCLGFDMFLGIEAFDSGSRQAGLASDPVLAQRILTLLEHTSGPLFIFGISMGNHGPWPHHDNSSRPFANTALQSFVAGLRQADRMLQILSEAPAIANASGLLAFYGDHQPSLPALAGAGRMDGNATDYIIRDYSRPPTSSDTNVRCDLPANALGSAILRYIDAPIGIRP